MVPIPQKDSHDYIFSHLVSLPLRFAEPITIGLHPNEVGPERAWMRSATVTALDVNGRRLIILNWHTIELYRLARRNHVGPGSIRVQIGSTPVDLEALLLDENCASDLAVLDASTLDLGRPVVPDMVNDFTEIGDATAEEAYVALQYHKPVPWPATDIRPGDALALGGYPEFMRTRAGAEVTHRAWCMAGVPITGDGYEEFRVTFDRTRWQGRFGTSHAGMLSKELSGLSGGPVFVDRGAEGAMMCSLVGFVKAYESAADMLVITSATNIRSDGMLKKRPAPIILDVQATQE